MIADDVRIVRDIRSLILDTKLSVNSEEDKFAEEKLELLDKVYDMLCEYEDLRERNKLWFRGFGYLDWLEPKEYFADSWRYLHTAFGSDDEGYDIVEKDEDYRYTRI